jgi:hypothetical protein
MLYWGKNLFSMHMVIITGAGSAHTNRNKRICKKRSWAEIRCTNTMYKWQFTYGRVIYEQVRRLSLALSTDITLVVLHFLVNFHKRAI